MPFTQSQTCQNANFKSRSSHICCETERFPFRIRSALSTSLTSNFTEATCISPPSSTGTAGKSWAGISPIPWVYSPRPECGTRRRGPFRRTGHPQLRPGQPIYQQRV